MKERNKGVFITFEGAEGSGKSTQIDLLAEYLKERGYQVLVTREPGGTSVGDNIRRVLLDPDFAAMDSRTELFLYVASRAQLVSEIIKPALAAEKIVLCDRFADSSLAYQGFGRGIALDEIKRLNKWATGGLSPQLTIVLSVPTQEGLDRATRDFADRLEKEDFDFHQRVKNGYEMLAKEYSDRIRLIEVAASPKDIHHMVVKFVEELLEKEEEK